MDNAFSPAPLAPAVLAIAREATCGELPLARGSASPPLASIVAGHRRVLCAISPDDAGKRIVQRVVAALAGGDGHRASLGIVSAAHFELPLDASACLYPTPLDRRVRLIIDRQRALDRLVAELGLHEAEVFATAGTPRREIRELAALWHADLLLFARNAGTGLRNRRGNAAICATVGLDDDGGVTKRSLLDCLMPF